ncbi:MAG: hypothetical protein HY914_17405 [Desulfomonile tiedjei]|nr:hypothetical protein [Desulfomonile tiedjei]
MYSRTTFMVVVCLVFLGVVFLTNAPAWEIRQAAFVDPQQQQQQPAPPAAPQTKPVTKVKQKTIVKCRPLAGFAGAYDPALRYVGVYDCLLPVERPQGGWEFSAELLFARTKGTVRNTQGATYYGTTGLADVDLNSDMGVPDHNLVPTFMARYRFRPSWSLRYSIMPMVTEETSALQNSFTFGTQIGMGYGQQTKVKWERQYHRLGLVYDTIRTPRARLSVFGDYVRLNERVALAGGYGGYGNSGALDNDLNMAMAGVEFERCLKTTRTYNTLSLECKAGVAFGDLAVGSDLSTGLKYSLPLGDGRWGFVKGGYRYVNYNKKYSEAKLMNTTLEGGFVQMGFVF